MESLETGGVHTLKKQDTNEKMHADHAELYLHCENLARRTTISTPSLKEDEKPVVQHLSKTQRRKQREKKKKKEGSGVVLHKG